MAVMSELIRGAAPQRAVGQPLDDEPEHAADHHGEERDPDRAADAGVLALAAERARAYQPIIRADHEDVAVGEVDQLQHAVDHGVAEGDERVDRAQRDAVDDVLEKLRHSWGARLRVRPAAGRCSRRPARGWTRPSPASGSAPASGPARRRPRSSSGREPRGPGPRRAWRDAFGIDAARELVLSAVRDLEHHRGLDGVAVLVHRDLAGDALVVLRLRQRVADGRAGEVARPLHRVEEHAGGVVGQRRERVGHLPAERLLELGDELLDARARVVHRVVVGEVAAVERGAADLVQLLAVPPVAAQERRGDAELARLPGDEADVGVVAGQVERLRMRCS